MKVDKNSSCQLLHTTEKCVTLLAGRHITYGMIPTLQRDHVSREWEILHNVIDTDQDIKVDIPEIYGGFYVVQVAETVKVYRM